MWIVQLALRRKFTFVVMALFIVIMGVLAIVRTPTDIFPEINVPVVSVIWQFTGLSPDEMEKRIITINERAMTTTVSNIEHQESQSMPGIGVIKVYFQPGTDPRAGVAQVTAICQTILRALPPGITPPLILQYSASSVPVLQIGVGSQTEPEQALYDNAQNFIRTQLITVQGAAIPLPYGGKPRQIMVDLDIQALQAKGLSPNDVDNAINAQNLILPAGTAKIGDTEYNVRVNSSPNVVDEFNNLPIKMVNGALVRMRDVAQVHDGYAVQTNIVNQNGKRAALLTILKSGDASTLRVVDGIKKMLPRVKGIIPPDIDLKLLFDQSVFVRASVGGVIREAAIAATLTAIMILLFLGSWRSTLAVIISIPLSILTSIIAMAAMGQTINIMTLGGLSLAVGILVDDATVEIENTNRNLAADRSASLTRAILESAQQIAGPALISTLSICIVFVPVVFLTGAAKSLFTPLAMAVVFAMLASYLLSRTLVPVMVQFLMGPDVDRIREEEGEQRPDCEVKPESGKESNKKENADGKERDEQEKDGAEKPENQEAKNGAAQDGSREGRQSDATQAKDGAEKSGKPDEKQNADEKPKDKKKPDIIWRVHHAFNTKFERARQVYCSGLAWALDHRPATCLMFVIFFLLSFCLLPFIGENFFPAVDAGQINLHASAAPGTRIEETEHQFHQVENLIRQTIPAPEIDTILDNIGLPVGGVNLAYSNSSTIGSLDGDILVSLNQKKHGDTEAYIETLRKTLAEKFPRMTFYFQPADITTQILNFGLPAPIDIQVTGRDPGNFAMAQQIARKVRDVEGVADVTLHQVQNVPELDVNVDRDKAQQLGLTQRDVAGNLLISLSGSGQTQPNYWLDPKNGVSYLVAVQTPQYNMNSVPALEQTPILPSGGGQMPQQLMSNLASIQRSRSPQVINHYNVQPTFDVYVSAQGRDLGGIAREINKILAPLKKQMKQGNTIEVRGQIESMNSSFLGLGLGLIFAIALVYLLMVVNFQSWLDPLVIVMALPGALSGILWLLFVTQTTFSVPSLMGSIMCIGVATSNSILMITFANERRAAGEDAIHAAQQAGFTRLRPVLMTALAMVLGMLPMALGLGEGGEQNAPLGRAVIGGLTAATVTTLFFVPVMYSLLRRKDTPEPAEVVEVDKYSAVAQDAEDAKKRKLVEEDKKRNEPENANNGAEKNGADAKDGAPPKEPDKAAAGE